MLNLVLLSTLVAIFQSDLVLGNKVPVQFAGFLTDSKGKLIEYIDQYSNKSSREFKELAVVLEKWSSLVIKDMKMFQKTVDNIQLSNISNMDGTAIPVIQVDMDTNGLEFDKNLCPYLSVMYNLMKGFYHTKRMAKYVLPILIEMGVPTKEQIKSWAFNISGVLSDKKGNPLPWSPKYKSKEIIEQVEKNLTNWIFNATDGITGVKLNSITKQDKYPSVDLTIVMKVPKLEGDPIDSRCLSWVAGIALNADLKDNPPRQGPKLIEMMFY